MKDEVKGLLERVKRATGPDRELDRAVWRALGGQVIPTTERGGHTHERWIDNTGTRWIVSFTRFSSSFDGAFGLLEKEFPDWWWIVRSIDKPESNRFKGPFLCNIGPPDSEWEAPACAATPPLAMLASILTALQSQGNEHG